MNNCVDGDVRLLVAGTPSDLDSRVVANRHMPHSILTRMQQGHTFSVISEAQEWLCNLTKVTQQNQISKI